MPSLRAATARWLLPLLAAASLAVAIAPDFAQADDAIVCNVQEAQSFLKRENYVLHRATSPDDRRRRKAAHQRAIRYRTQRYGYVDGFGDPATTSRTPKDYAQKTRFMGLRVTLNRRIVPALRCAEQRIRETCTEAYVPTSLSGLREGNTFYNGEASNHLYGIALDVDPEKNFCCGCVGAAANHPACKRQSSLEERMKMPACWVDAFERYGFYWLGRDELEDTMHFEFLGDPDRIVGPASQ